MKKISKNVLIFILSGIVIGSLGVYAATQINSKDVIYKDEVTVESAINDLYSKVTKCSGNSCKCKRATTLHTEICNSADSFGCKAAGYAANATITYGQLGHSGTLRPGDAYDCDVNGDGTYDSETERFYYVATSNGILTLIYYNNVSGGEASNTAMYAYYGSVAENWHGPERAKLQLPKTSGTNAWSNVSLKNTERGILNETGGTTTNGGPLPTSFSYAGYAARLLTAQEVNTACNITVGSRMTGELDTCQYLMENTKFSNGSYTYGYWLETPVSNKSDCVWYVFCDSRSVSDSYAHFSTHHGIRPAIEVSVNDIEY